MLLYELILLTFAFAFALAKLLISQHFLFLPPGKQYFVFDPAPGIEVVIHGRATILPAHLRAQAAALIEQQR